MKLLLLAAVLAISTSLIHCSENRPSALAHSLPVKANEVDLCVVFEDERIESDVVRTPLLSARATHHSASSLQIADNGASIVQTWITSLNQQDGLPNKLGSSHRSILLLASEVAATLQTKHASLWQKIVEVNGEQTTIEAFKTAMRSLYPNLKL